MTATEQQQLNDIFSLGNYNIKTSTTANPNPSGFRLLVSIVVVWVIFNALPGTARGWFIALLALGGLAGIASTNKGLDGFVNALKGKG